MQRDYGTVLIDIAYFGLHPVIAWSRRHELTCADHHPNDRGYALIAEIVHQSLRAGGLPADRDSGHAPP
jgi:hypothetical protein